MGAMCVSRTPVVRQFLPGRIESVSASFLPVMCDLGRTLGSADVRCIPWRGCCQLRVMRCTNFCSQGVREKADDPAFQREWQKMKLTAKVRALAKISAVTGVKLPENALLDVQVRCMAENENRCPGSHLL